MNLKVNRRFPWIHHVMISRFPHFPFILWTIFHSFIAGPCFLLTPSSSLCNCSIFYSSKHLLMIWTPLSQFLRTSTRMFVSHCLIICSHSDSLTLTSISSVVRYLRFRKIQVRDISGHLWSVHSVRTLHRILQQTLYPIPLGKCHESMMLITKHSFARGKDDCSTHISLRP